MGTLIPEDLSFADSAPVVAEHTATIDGTPEEVWAAVLDYERWPTWFPGVKSCRATSDPATGVGSTRRVAIPGSTVDERFIAWEDERLWAFTALNGPPGFERLVERITLEQLGPRLTQITYRMAIGPRRGYSTVLKLARGRLEKNLQVALRNLNAEVARNRTATA